MPTVRVLVTGATGRVGHAVATALIERGDDVRALVRDPARAAAILPAGAEPVTGDVTDRDSLDRACEGCELVFNAMGLPEQWVADEETFDRVNARGTENVVRAAAKAGVPRVVHTSTIDVFHAEPGARFDESTVADYPKGTVYERSKQRAEKLALEAAEDGVEVVLVNPAGVYGPGPGGDATSFQKTLFEPLIESRRLDVPMLPPGRIALVHSPGVARGHLLAAERGRHGERYILSDAHVDFALLARKVVQIAGRGIVPPVMPIWLAKGLAAGGERVSRVTGKPPLLPAGQLFFFLWNATPDSTKARRELGWEPTPLDDGLRATLAA